MTAKKFLVSISHFILLLFCLLNSCTVRTFTHLSKSADLKPVLKYKRICVFFFTLIVTPILIIRNIDSPLIFCYY